MTNEFIYSHLDHLTVEMLQNELITNIIRGLKKKAEDEQVPVNSSKFILLSRLSTQPPSYSTVVCCLHSLGFMHGKFKKSYYVDGHEHKEQKQHQTVFIDRYLLDLERHTHRWVQMSIVEFEEIQSSLPDDNKTIHSGYCYSHPVTRDEWIEFHIDDVHSVCEHNIGPFGGNISVRFPAGSKPLFIFGQDELIFKQFSHSTKQWLGPSGQRSIMPDCWYGHNALVLSITQCKFTNSKSVPIFFLFIIDEPRLIVALQFGWGLQIDVKKLKEINESRRGKDYFDMTAATAVNGHTKKDRTN